MSPNQRSEVRDANEMLAREETRAFDRHIFGPNADIVAMVKHRINNVLGAGESLNRGAIY